MFAFLVSLLGVNVLNQGLYYLMSAPLAFDNLSTEDHEIFRTMVHDCVWHEDILVDLQRRDHLR